jgi:hypothetical protein
MPHSREASRNDRVPQTYFSMATLIAVQMAPKHGIGIIEFEPEDFRVGEQSIVVVGK